MRQFKLITISLITIAFMAACGNSTENGVSGEDIASPSKGGVTVLIEKATTTKESGGYIDACQLELVLDNRSGKPLRSVRIAFTIEAMESWQQATVDAAGEQAFYFSRPQKGKTIKTDSIRGLTCEQIKAVRIGTIGCATKEGTCSANSVQIDSGGLLPIVEE